MNNSNKLSKFCGYALLLVGVVSSIGWTFGIDLLTRFDTGTVPIAPDSAFLFLLFGLYFVLDTKANKFNKYFITSSLTFILIYSLLKFLQLFIHSDLTFSELIFPTSQKIGVYLVKRMSPFSGLLLFFSSLVSLKIKFELNKTYWNILSDIICSGIFVFAYIISIGYLFGTPFLYEGKVLPMAFLTALGLLIISCGLFIQNSDNSIIIGKFSETSAGMKLIRRIIPIVFATVILQGILLENITEIKYINHPMISALFSLIISIIISIIIYRLSKVIFKKTTELEMKQKIFEKELKDSELYFKALFESNSSAIAIIESDTKISMVNDAYCKMSGYPRETVIGMSWTEQIPPSDLERLKEYNRIRLMNPADAPDNYEFTFYHHDGNIKYGLMSIATITLSDEIKFIASFADITERKIDEGLLAKQSEELIELNATKDKFFSIIAHDLKSPFNTILGFADLLLTDYKNMDSQEIKSLIQSLKITSQNTYELLDNLLIWGQAQTGRNSFKPEAINLKNLIIDNKSLSETTAHKKNISIISYVPDYCFIYADFNMINTVIRNLINNAIKFTYPNGKIIISANLNDDNWIISVKDNGIGIDESNIEKLFKIDSKYSTLGTENEHGTGLGLILCKEFVEKNGGAIEVKSKLNEGAEFIIKLPAVSNYEENEENE